MRLNRLRLTGFKSFVEPTELCIEPGLTGIVGPNGCGKSNLLEAIRWVMGETSARSVRAGGMDDVIFAGTATRPAREFAEVALVGDSEGAALPGLMAEGESGALEIVRRIERGAGSAYRANGRDVRARDVALLFADAATGAHSPALVSQGKVAGIVGARPQERRQLLEEAAGIAGLHARRKDAEGKLRATEANLARIAELGADMEARAAQLRRQARAAERYTRLSDAIRVAEARMIFALWQAAARAADAARAEAKAADARVAEAQACAGAATTGQAEAMAGLTHARDAVAAARDADHGAASALGAARAERDAVARRLAELDAEAARIAAERAAEDALARDGAAAIDRFAREEEEAGRAVTAAMEARPRLLDDATRASDRTRDAEIALAEARAAAANESANRRIAAAAIEEASRRLRRLESERARLDAQLRDAGDERVLREAARMARAATDDGATGMAAAEARLASTAEEREAAAEGLARVDAARAEARAAVAALESELAALDRSLAATAHDLRGVLADIAVAPGYEAALAAALGDDLSAPLAPGDRARGWSGAPTVAAAPGNLLDHVRAPAALHARLGQIIVCDVDDGRPLAPGQRMVTRDGAMRRWDGFRSIGDGSVAAERLARVNRRAAVAQQLPQVGEALARIDTAHAAATTLLADAVRAQDAARQRLDAIERRARDAARAADAADAALARHRTTIQHLTERRDAMAPEVAEAARLLREAHAAMGALPDGARTAAMLSGCETAAHDARAATEGARGALSALERRMAVAREAAIEAAAELRGWSARTAEAGRRLEAIDRRHGEISAQVKALADRPAALDAAIVDAEQRREEAARAVSDAQLAERAAMDRARRADTVLDAAREALAAAREGRAATAARAEHEEARRIEMGRIAGERFECPPPLLPAQVSFDAGTVGTAAQESMAHERLLQERERIGPVNLVAAQELEALDAEQVVMTREAEELALAVNRLRGSIGHLNRDGRARLLAAFEAVDGHFRILFDTLFGGGAARLELVESDDPLEAGLEIMAQPPGKKLASLTLLSGGEQALTAVALIFALFLTNPAPICVLDEVDAPLDDANVDRFCDLLDRMTRETATRYLIVTHNAVTMARMHRLFGVTMVERGVSRLVSVDLGAAEELLAAE